MNESEAIEGQVDQGGPGDGGGLDVSARSVAEHLSSLLVSADSTARRIVEEAETRARDQLAQLERRVREIEEESARLASWRRQTEEMIQSLASAIDGFRKDVENVPERISEALDPLASHVPVVIRQMMQLTSALRGGNSNDGPAEDPGQAAWHTDWADLGAEES